ncbi:MAG TPA: PepSY-like domain-containing protein [Desulfuromonadaceae bacterium]|nr:PepSY-like domain-containing protein [Desulfuromonadaceae bacterium]
MNTKPFTPSLWIIAVILSLPAANLKAGPVPLTSLPAKLQDGIKGQSALGTVAGIDQTIDDNETNYDVVFKKGAAERTLTFTPAGKVTSFQIFETNLPSFVVQMLNTDFKGMKPVEIYRVTEDDKPYYDLEIRSGNSTNSLSIAESGHWWSLDIGIEDAPAPVRTFIERRFAKDGYDSISRTKEDGKIYYEAEGDINNHAVHFDITEDGRQIAREEEVTFEEVTPPAQKTIQAHFTPAEITSITRRTENNDVTFEVEADHNGQAVSMIVGHGGRIRQSEK